MITEDDYPNLSHPSGAVLDIVQIISEFLLNIEYDDLLMVPKTLMIEEVVQSISTYPTSRQFHRICAAVKSEWGDDTFPIVVQFNMDGMPADSLGKRSLKPYKIRVKNVSDRLQSSTCNMFTIGYGPVHHYTKPQLMEMISKKVYNKTTREKEAYPFIQRYEYPYVPLCTVMFFMSHLCSSDRRANQDFFRAILTQLEDTMFEPVLLRVGKDDSKPPLKFVILASTWSNDNDEVYMCAGCNMRSRYQKCRICVVSATDMHETNVSINAPLRRDGDYLADLTNRSQIPFMKRMTKIPNAR